MAEVEQTTASEKRPQERSPSFPYIGLTKALERAGGLLDFAKRHDVRIIDAAKPAWDMGPKSSSTLQTVAALLAFGLIEASGTGDGRKVRLSDAGFRALSDPRPGVKESSLKELALKPKAIAELRERWGDERPADPIAVADLHVDRGFTSEGAKAFLRVYDDTVAYAGPAPRDKSTDSANKPAEPLPPRSGDVAVGDVVRVEVAGQIIVDEATVRAVHEHEGHKWVFVEGSETGVLMTDTILVEKSPPAVLTPPVLPLTPKAEALTVAPEEEMDRFTVDEGVVKIAFPSGMSVDSLDDLDEFFKLFIKKAKRRAGAQVAG